MRKPAFCICENKDTDPLHSNCAADWRLCFCYTDSTIPPLPKSGILKPLAFFCLYSPVCVGPGQQPRRPVFSQRRSYIPVSHHFPLFTGLFLNENFCWSDTASVSSPIQKRTNPTISWAVQYGLITELPSALMNITGKLTVNTQNACES